VRPRGRGGREPDPVGDGGLQAAPPLAQRRALQADLRLIHRFQKHCFQSGQRVKAMSERGFKSLHTYIYIYIYIDIYIEVFKLYNHQVAVSKHLLFLKHNYRVCIEYYNV